MNVEGMGVYFNFLSCVKDKELLNLKHFQNNVCYRWQSQNSAYMHMLL